MIINMGNTMTVIYRENGVELRVGDKLKLAMPIADQGFFGSKVGKLFESKKCDTAYLEAIQADWLEVKFRLTLELNGKPVTNLELDDDPDKLLKELEELDVKSSPDNKRYLEHMKAPFFEDADYMFLRYMIRKGAQIIK